MPYFKVTLAITAAHFLTGTASVATRYLVAWLDPVEIACLRYLLGGLFICPVFFLHKSKKPDKPYVMNSIFLGMLFFALFPLLFSTAFQYTSAARGSLVLATMPLWAMLIGYFSKHEIITLRMVAGVLITIAGLAIALQDKLLGSANELMSFKGELFMLAAAFVGAVYSIIAKSTLRNAHANKFTPVAMFSGCLSLSPWALSSNVIPDLYALDIGKLCIVLYLGCIAGGVAFYLFNWVLDKSSATISTLFVSINPLTAIFLAWLLLNEKIMISFFIGTGVVLSGIIITQWPQNSSS